MTERFQSQELSASPPALRENQTAELLPPGSSPVEWATNVFPTAKWPSSTDFSGPNSGYGT